MNAWHKIALFQMLVLIALAGAAFAVPICGNGFVEPGEACDGANVNGYGCQGVAAGFVTGTLGCRPDCLGYDVSACNKGGTVYASSCNQG